MSLFLLSAVIFYRAATQNSSRSDNPAFQAIFNNAVSVKIYDFNPYKNPRQGKTPLVILDKQSHSQQFQWFTATNHFIPDQLQGMDELRLIVDTSDGKKHGLGYDHGTLVCEDAAIKGSALPNAQFVRWLESIKPHHKPPPYKKPSQSSTQSSGKP